MPEPAHTITIEIPPGATLGDLTTVQGAIFNAATEFVDWDSIHLRQPDAISTPGHILMAIAKELKT